MDDPLLGAPGGYNVTFGPTDRGYGMEAAPGTDTNSTHWRVFKQVGAREWVCGVLVGARSTVLRGRRTARAARSHLLGAPHTPAFEQRQQRCC